VPLVEKLAEHLTAVDEAYDNQVCCSFTSPTGVYALSSTDEFRAGSCPWSHNPDGTLQLFAYRPDRMGCSQGHGRCSLGLPKFVACSLLQDLNFELFNIIVLIMAIIVVGNFLRDLKSNYLEGALCILVYLLISVSKCV